MAKGKQKITNAEALERVLGMFTNMGDLAKKLDPPQTRTAISIWRTRHKSVPIKYSPQITKLTGLTPQEIRPEDYR